MEAEAIKPLFEVDGVPVNPQAGARDLPDGPFAILYSMGDVERRISFQDNHTSIRTAMNDGESVQRFVEQIPLLLAEEDTLDVNDEDNTVVMLRDGNAVLTIAFSAFENASVIEGDRIEGLRLVSVHVATSEPPNYDIKF